MTESPSNNYCPWGQIHMEYESTHSHWSADIRKMSIAFVIWLSHFCMDMIGRIRWHWKLTIHVFIFFSFLFLSPNSQDTEYEFQHLFDVDFDSKRTWQPAARLRGIVSPVAKNLNSVKHFVNLHAQSWEMYMKILFRTTNYERLFTYFEQSSITWQFSVSLPAATMFSSESFIILQSVQFFPKK